MLYTLVLFVAWDLSRFALHWALHRFETLWQFHQVHHSAEVLTPFTLYRSHPVESLLYGLRGVVVTGVVTAAPSPASTKAASGPMARHLRGTPSFASSIIRPGAASSAGS